MSVICIIVAYGSPELLQRAVNSAISAGVERVHIWDNSGLSRVQDQFSSYDRVHVHGDGHNWGFGGGVNRAAALAQSRDGDQLLLLNPDAEIEARSLSLLRAELASDPGIAAPRMRYPDGSFGIVGGSRPRLIKEVLASARIDDLLPARVRNRLLTWFGSRDSGSLGASMLSGAPLSVDWVSGFCMLVSHEAFYAVAGFDESYFLYFEDVDLCLRAGVAGYRSRVVREAVASHIESATTSTAKSSHYARGRSQYFSTHGSALERLAFGERKVK